ncbi:hypothetical protein L195_g030820, partial [Trifolium pratense]
MIHIHLTYADACDLVLVVGIISYGPDVQPNGEAKCVKGCLLVLRLDNVQNSPDGFKTFYLNGSIAVLSSAHLKVQYSFSYRLPADDALL